MGCCCGKKMMTKKKAFPQELGAPLLDSVALQLGRNAKVVVARLKSLSHMELSDSILPVNAFIRIRLSPADEVGGIQEQTSSINPGTANPTWEPPERFQFIVSDVRKSNLLLSVYHYDEANPKDYAPIGDVVIRLGSLNLRDTEEMKTFNLVSPADGQRRGEATLSMMMLAPKDAQNVIEDTVYEYQEWSLMNDWAPLTIPGRWSTPDGKKFTEDLEQAGLKIPEGFRVSATWFIMSTHYDPDGWQYATALDSPFWHFENKSALFVLRRRTWKRELRKGRPKSKPAASATDKK